MSNAYLYDKIGQFTTVPNSVIQLAPQFGVDGLALFVYLRFRTNSDSGTAFPAYERIQNEIGMPRKRIAKAIRALEAAGLVERKKRFGQSTIYTLTLPVVPHRNYSSAASELSVVPQVHANYTDSIKTESSIAPMAQPFDKDAYRQRIANAVAGGQETQDGLVKALEQLTGLNLSRPTKTEQGYLKDLREWKATPSQCAHFAHYLQVVEAWRTSKPDLKTVWQKWHDVAGWNPKPKPAPSSWGKKWDAMGNEITEGTSAD